MTTRISESNPTLPAPSTPGSRNHRLDPLLRPRSIAVLGATERPHSVGRRTMENLLHGDYSGRLYAVNPGHRSICGVDCFPSLEQLPEPVEHVIFAVGDPRVEAALDGAIAHGVKAVTLMSSLVLADDAQPPLKDRIRQKVQDSGLLVCGGNAMGFFNFTDRVWACGFDTRDHRREGSVTLISHSGSGMCGIVDVDERIDFNLAVSTGQELSVAMPEYMDFALDQPETRVIGLFMETAREPEALIRALDKANRRNIPVVALKVGCTELSARLTVSHSGAVAGRDAAYEALFDRYGVQRVEDMDQLATALILFAQPHPVAAGGLVAIHDSGGERQLLIDLADRTGVPLAQVSPDTTARLAQRLDPGLPPVNPLDAWGAGGPDSDRIMEDCLAALMADPDAALGAVIHDRAPGGCLYPEYIDYLRKGHEASGKPVFLVANRQGTGSDPRVVSVTREGFPVLDGVTSFLMGVKCLLGYRDFCNRPEMAPPDPPDSAVERWMPRLFSAETVDEAEAMDLIRDFALPANPCRIVNDEKALVAAAADLGYPVVLKCADPGVSHKTEHGGVVLDVPNEAVLLRAYRSMRKRLGPGVLLAPMIDEPGVEMILGVVRDAQFGPLVTVGFGGVDVEAIDDVAWGLPPFDAATARRLVDSLRLRAMLDRRGRPAPDLDAFCEAAARLSVLATCLDRVPMEIDLNPVIVTSSGCVAVDALVRVATTDMSKR